MSNNLNITDNLIKAGVRLNIQDNSGCTALDYGKNFFF
jgi:hypothetical protein